MIYFTRKSIYFILVFILNKNLIDNNCLSILCLSRALLNLIFKITKYIRLSVIVIKC